MTKDTPSAPSAAASAASSLHSSALRAAPAPNLAPSSPNLALTIEVPPQNIPLVRALKLQAASFPQQLAIIKDPAKRIAIFVPRRGAKTSSVVLLYLMYALMYSNIRLVFIGLTGDSAENAFLPHAEQFLQQCNIYANQHYIFNRSERSFTFLATNSIISLKGFDMSYKEMDKILGGKCFSVAIDECQSHTQDLEKAILYKIQPAVSDYLPIGGGSIFTLGTAGDYMGDNFWYRIVSEPNHLGWSFHTWEGKDNPYMAQAKELEDQQFRQQYGECYQELDWYKQQYLNLWISSGKRMVYQHTSKNVLGHPECATPMPPQHFFDRATGAIYGLGMDFGFSPDPMAFVVVCYNTRYANQMFVLFEHKQNEMYIPDIHNYIKQLDARYHFSFMVADAGAQAKAQVADLNNNFGWSIVPADKLGKLAHINTFNGDLRAGTILVHPECRQLMDEWANLIWDPIALNTQNKRQEKEGMSNDLCLVGGTLIQTSDGPAKIEDIQPGHLVLTRQGYQPVLASAMTGIEPIFRLTTLNGRTITGTGGHKVIAGRGRIPLRELKSGDILTCIEEHQCQTSMEHPSHLSTKALPIAAIPTHPIDTIESTGSARAAMVIKFNTYIELFINNISEQFRMVMLFIIEMTTRLTTNPVIYNSLPSLNTNHSILLCAGRTTPIEPKGSSCWMLSAHLPKNGMLQKQVASGINSMQKMFGQVKKQINHIFAKSAICLSKPKPTEPIFVPTNASPSKDEIVVSTMKTESVPIVKLPSELINTAKPKVVVDYVTTITELTISAPVYNLTVANHHEYFANGILVANCDATLYAHFYCRHNWYQTPKVKLPVTMTQFNYDLAKELIGRNKPRPSISGGYLPPAFQGINFAKAGYKAGRK